MLLRIWVKFRTVVGKEERKDAIWTDSLVEGDMCRMRRCCL